jgi:hypothetical protein
MEIQTNKYKFGINIPMWRKIIFYVFFPINILILVVWYLLKRISTALTGGLYEFDVKVTQNF